MNNHYNNSACIICGSWEPGMLTEHSKDKICENCKKKQKNVKVQCALEECENTFVKKSSAEKYCVMCKGLSKSEKESRIRQLKLRKEKNILTSDN